MIPLRAMAKKETVNDPLNLYSDPAMVDIVVSYLIFDPRFEDCYVFVFGACISFYFRLLGHVPLCICCGLAARVNSGRGSRYKNSVCLIAAFYIM